MFQTYPIALQQLLKDAHEGKLQLPDFQRSFVWSDDAIQSLIASVAKGYPIGAFLSLQTGERSGSNLVSWKELMDPEAPRHKNYYWTVSNDSLHFTRLCIQSVQYGR